MIYVNCLLCCIVLVKYLVCTCNILVDILFQDCIICLGACEEYCVLKTILYALCAHLIKEVYLRSMKYVC